MLLVIFIIISILGILGCILGYYKEYELLNIIAAIMVGVGIVNIMLLGGIGIYTNITRDKTIAGFQAERESLVYQLDEVKYNNLLDNGKQELYKQVTAYNKRVDEYIALDDNFWIGNLIPTISNEVSRISL